MPYLYNRIVQRLLYVVSLASLGFSIGIANAATTTNLIADPGFESGVAGFAPKTFSDSAVRTTIKPIQGAGSLKVKINTNANEVRWGALAGAGRTSATQLKVTALARNDVTTTSRIQVCAVALYTNDVSVKSCTPASRTVGVVNTISATVNIDPARTLYRVGLHFIQEGTQAVTYSVDNVSAFLTYNAGTMPSPTPRPSATPAPTATPRPSATPVPTATPAPTATPRPSATPFPTAAPTPVPTPGPTPPPATAGTTTLKLTADLGAASNTIVSSGIPFAPGKLSDETKIVLYNASNTQVPIQTQVLARWPHDNSIRSVLVMFRATLASGATATYRLDFGATRTASATGLTPNPDGPVSALLPASYYSASEVMGRLVPVSQNTRFASYDTQLESKLWGMSPGYETYGSSCDSTNGHRTYYGGTHAMYQLFLRTADAKHYRRARKEATVYRTNELRWFSNRTMAVHVCQGTSWAPTTQLQWHVVRRMDAQGMLADYLVTGDAAAKEATVGIGEAFRQNLPVLTTGREIMVEITERNMAWPLMGLASYYAVSGSTSARDAMNSLVTRAVAWQNRGNSGSFEHDIVRPDPSECGNGPNGASPFMTSLLVDGLMEVHALTRDARVADVVSRAARWYENMAVTSDGRAFRYLWNCFSNSYNDSSTADLNLLIVHVMGAAYSLTGDSSFLTFGDRIADSGVSSMYVSRPKNWNQSARTFGKYMGYRSKARTP